MDVRSLRSGIVFGRMSLPLVVCVCMCVPGVPVLVKSGHRVRLYSIACGRMPLSSVVCVCVYVCVCVCVCVPGVPVLVKSGHRVRR